MSLVRVKINELENFDILLEIETETPYTDRNKKLFVSVNLKFHSVVFVISRYYKRYTVKGPF
jgi:hypothetical protein